MKFEKLSKVLETLNDKAYVAKHTLEKYKPLIEVVGGISMFTGAAVTAYRARKEVEEVFNDVEYRRANGEDVRSGEVVLRTAKAMALPIGLGIGGALLITDSYRTLMGRIGLLSSSLASATLENARYKKYIQENHPGVPTEVPAGKHQVIEHGENGEEYVNEIDIVDDKDGTIFERIYFHNSAIFESDNLLYNQMAITAVESAITRKLYSRGVVKFNEVIDGFEIIRGVEDIDRRKGAILGWTDTTGFGITTVAMRVFDKERGCEVNTIKISFDVPPTYIYDVQASDLMEYAY